MRVNDKVVDKLKEYLSASDGYRLPESNLPSACPHLDRWATKASPEVISQMSKQKQQTLDYIKGKFGGSSEGMQYAHMLVDLVDKNVARNYLNQEEADSILKAVGGTSSHIALRTTRGLDEVVLSLIAYFNPAVDYYIYSPFINMARMNIKENKVESLQQYSKADRRALKGPLIYTSAEMKQIVHEIIEAERCMNPKWNDMQKFVYFQNYIVSTIKYNKQWRDTVNEIVPPYNCNKSRFENNSLRGLISKETICLGYSIILAEFLDRQGIENYINVNSSHAHNVVRLDGKFYLVDLVSEAAMLFCSGEFDEPVWVGRDTKEFFADAKHKFEITLIPNQPNPDFKILDNSVYQDTLKQVLRRRQYDRLSFNMDVNGQKVNVTQIGSLKINNKKYFQYLYQKAPYESNIPALVFCRNNLSELMYQKSEGVKVDPLLEQGILAMLDIHNVEESTKKYNGDIGSMYKNKEGQVVAGAKRVEKETKELDNTAGVYRRDDGAVVVVIPKEIKKATVNGESTIMYPYDVFVRKIKNNKVKYQGYTICSEKNFGLYTSDEERECFINTLLSDDSLITTVRDYRGYVGAIQKSGNTCSLVRNEKLKSGFATAVIIK